MLNKTAKKNRRKPFFGLPAALVSYFMKNETRRSGNPPVKVIKAPPIGVEPIEEALIAVRVDGAHSEIPVCSRCRLHNFLQAAVLHGGYNITVTIGCQSPKNFYFALTPALIND